jgi:hypothetical protein
MVSAPKQRKSEAKNEIVVIEIEWIRGLVSATRL